MGLDEELIKNNFSKEESWNESFSIVSFVKKSQIVKNNLKGIVVMIFASLFLGLMGFFIKVTFQKFPLLGAFDVLLVRSLLMVLIYFPYAKYLGVNVVDVNMKNSVLIFFR